MRILYLPRSLREKRFRTSSDPPLSHFVQKQDHDSIRARKEKVLGSDSRREESTLKPWDIREETGKDD